MGDFIDREQAIKCAEKSYKMWNLTMAAADGEREINKCYKMQELCKTIEEVFKIVPAADVAPVVHGQWVNGCQCSVCGDRHGPYNSRHKPFYNYCPHCGAKMDEEEQNGNV